MPIKCILVLIAGAFLATGSTQTEDNRRFPSNYVKLEVRGTLVHKGTMYDIETSDAMFSNVKLLVRLERSEDKNHFLDRHLEALNGKSVVAHGFLDCRRVGQAEGIIYLQLRSESQVTATEDK